MTRMSFVNGELIPFESARLPINDRGLTMGDGVYEVIAVVDGALVDVRAHHSRLSRSLNELDIPNPYKDDEWIAFHEELIAANDLHQGTVYLQVSRGSFEREFAVPNPPLTPNVVMFTQVKDIVGSPAAASGIQVVTMPELRWSRRDIKSISLIGAVLGKQKAAQLGGKEVWFVEDGILTEGGSSNIFIVTRDDRLLTRELSHALLGGITRAAIIEIARDLDIPIEEVGFSVDTVLDAKEAFSTSASTFLTPVIQVDGKPVGDGTVGPLTKKLRSRYIEHAYQGGRLK